MERLYESVNEAAAYLRERGAPRPDAAIILGTGLGRVAERVRATTRIPFEEIPHFPASTVDVHRGHLLFGEFGGRTVVVMEGRLHYYEGLTLQQVTIPVRIMRELGAGLLFINSAAGGLDTNFRAGDVMIVTDHINLIGESPLRGITDPRLGERFPDMSRPYDESLMDTASRVAPDLHIPVRYGVYAAVAGPHLETRAETRMLRLLGAHAVGMSTVPEVIVAGQVGFRTLALAAITNVNLPDAMQPVSLDEVVRNAGKAEPFIAALIEETLRRSGRAGVVP
jgi:purine-nucleoside phosphorylase